MICFFCRGSFAFAPAILLLPLLSCFCRGLFAFSVTFFAFSVTFFAFAVAFLLLPWQLWATVVECLFAYVMSLFAVFYCTPLLKSTNLLILVTDQKSKAVGLPF